MQPVTDDLNGHKIIDNYRWLEDAGSLETQEFVRQELAYTRGILDPLPGREKILERLQQLALVGTIGAPQPGGKYYFYTRREGTQNQPQLLVREGVQGADRALVDVNQMAADGTVALDWWYPSDDGKYVAYGTSHSGSEESTLYVIETATGKLLGDTIERTRFSSVAWKKDNSGFYYTRQEGRRARGRRGVPRQGFLSSSGRRPGKGCPDFRGGASGAKYSWGTAGR
jgi:prolyl oligopeptidase